MNESLFPAGFAAIFDRSGAAPEGGSAAIAAPGSRFQSATPDSDAGASAALLADTADGLVATGAIAATSGNGTVFIDDVITGYTSDVGSAVPSEIVTIRPVTGCRLTAPLKGTVVGHVTAGRSNLALPIATYDDVQLAAAVQTFVNAYRSTGSAESFNLAAPSYEAYDVAVTETRSPVYLVLESGSGNRIWNIHLAEGARVERVILLGGDQAGVANLDPVVPVEVILNKGLAGCGILPAYSLNSGHRFYRSMKDGDLPAEDAAARVAELRAAVDAYDAWFRDTFGILADQTRAGFDVGSISLVGPVPGESDPKAVYAGIQAAKVRTTRASYFEISGQVPEGEALADRAKAIATTFAFGDLSYLRQGVGF